MSTILDALKKSEQERKLNNVPTLSDMPTPQETKSWPLVLLFIAILLLSILVAVLFFRTQASDQDQDVSKVNSSLEVTGKPSALVVSDADIVVNVVSYSEQQELSFVMINGKLFRNGEFVLAGLRVEEIKPDEVVLNLRGKRITRKP